MTREKFKQNLIEALTDEYEFWGEETENKIEKLLDLNYDEDGDWDWTYADFKGFAVTLANNYENFWFTAEQFGLHVPEKYKEGGEENGLEED